MVNQSPAARPDADLPAYKAMIAVVTFGVWLLGFVDVFGQGLFSAELHPGLPFYPTSFYLFTLVVGLAALRRGYGPTWLEGVASRKVTLGVTVVLWLLTILRMEEQLFELPYLAFLDGVFGAPTEASFISFWPIAFFTLLHSLDAHVVRRRSSRLAWLSYGLLCAIVMLALHQVGDLVLAIGHPDLEGLSLIASVMICSFAGFIAPETPAVGLLYDERTPKTNALGLLAPLVVLVCHFAVGIVVDNSLYIFSAGTLVLAGLPFALSALRSSELQKRIAAGDMTPEGVLTKFVPERRYFGNTYRPSGIFARMSVYAVFDAPEWQRYVIQAVVTFALAVGAIVLGRMADTPIATIWWANGYLAYCLVLRPKTQWAASVVLFYAVVLFVNLLAGNPFVPSSLLSGVNAVEGVVIATLIVAIFGLRVHGRQLSSVRISVSSYTALILAVTLVHAFGSLIGGGLVTFLFEGSLALNMLTWGSGGLIGSGTILMLFSGKVLEQHLGFKRLEPRIQRFGLFACLYVGTVFALYAFLPVNALLAMPHILFVVLSLPLVLLSSLYQAGSLFVVTSSIYFYFVQSRLGLDGWLIQAKLMLIITIVASIIILALIARYVSAKAREGEKRALDLAPNALLTLDAQRRVLTISKNAQEWFDASEAKLEGRRIDDLFEDFTPHAQAVTDQFQANPTASYTAQVTRTLASGVTLTLEVTFQGTDDVSLPYAYVVSVVDVTKETQLVRSNRGLIDRSQSIVLVQDTHWNSLQCSDAWCEFTGYSRDETIGHDLHEFLHPEDKARGKVERDKLLINRDYEPLSKEAYRLITKSGVTKHIQIRTTEPLEGSQKQFLATFFDLTELVESRAHLYHLVQHDDLTGLYSRRGLKKRFGDGMRKKTAGVYIFDLDHFKSVNDSYGHEAGDALLSAIGQTMMRLTETVGCAARLGGEEFAIIRPWQGWKEAKEFGEALRLALEQTVVVSGGRTISRTASIGIAKLGTSEVLSDVMRLADDFAREAKLRGRNMVCAGEEEELRALELRGTFITAEEVQLALEAGEFYYAVQPIWDVEARRIEGFEALIRWQKADGTVLSPLQFVSVFDEVTREPAFAALNTAMRKDVLTKLSDFSEAYVSFNYKLEQLGYVGAAEALMGVYEVAKDSPDRVIMIELSEKALAQRGDLDVLRAELKILGENGFVIALDDFGVESSNLSRLQALPIQVVKLDKVLIDDLTTSERVRSIVSGIAMIVRSLNMKVIVEGVETIQQAQALMHHHIVTQQGYVHAKPMRPKEVVGQLSKIGADVVIGESAEKALDIL